MGSVERRRTTVAPEEPTTDLFISGVDSMADIGGGMIRAVFYVNRATEGGRTVRVICPQAVVCPVSAMPDAIGKAVMALGRKVIARDDGSLTVAH